MDDVKIIEEVDVDYFGLIFAQSKRQVTKEQAAIYTKILRTKKKKAVGVFVEQSIKEIVEYALFCQLDVVQIHRRFKEKELIELRKHLDKSIAIWQVVAIDHKMPNNLQEIKRVCDLILFDTKGKNAGGNGIKFKWQLLENVEGDFGVAGGIDADDIIELAQYHPRIIDVNSKLETNNQKDKTKVLQFLKRLKTLQEE